MTILEANLKILDIISNYIKTNPDQRFCQVLCNLGLPFISIVTKDGTTQHVDKFFEESDKTLEIVNQVIPQQSKAQYQWNPRFRRHEIVENSNR